MSVDVFGRQLGRSSESIRGAPGVGYKITADGQFDIENKRLCNIAEPRESGDAVNLQTLQRIVETEIKSLHEVTTRLRADLDNLDVIVDSHRDDIDKKLSKIEFTLQDLQDAAASSGGTS